MTTPDDLTTTVHRALTALDPAHQAEFLLDTALALIDAGRYGDEVERYLDVYLKTPNLPKTKVAKALLARANARKACGDKLLAQAHQDYQAVLRLDPSNRDVASQIRRRTQIRFAHDPPSHRAPLEVWSRIATYIPRYHLRTWLWLSSFHRSIALHHIFHTIDLYLGEDQPENVNRSMDIFERVKSDKDFASRVRVLRVHWAYEEGDLLDLMLRVFKTTLPEFHALREFEWIGYPELRQDMVQFLLNVHPRLVSLGSIGFHFDACGISAFNSLRKLTLRAEDDDGYADWSEITTVLNNNSKTLKHLTLGAYLLRQHSWDATFSSPTIHNLTHLDLVDTRISHTVLSRIAHAAGGVGSRLESLTLHGVIEEPGKAAVIFGSDEVINGEHTFLPRLKSFRFLLVGQPQVITPPPPAQAPLPLPPPSVSAPPGHHQSYYHPYPPHLGHPSAPAPQPTQPAPLLPQQQQQHPHPQDHYDPTILHLYSTIVHFLRGRTNLRRLDLGNCPWDLVAPILPGLKGLRVFGVRIGCLSRGCGASNTASGHVTAFGDVDLNGCMSELDVLVKCLPREVGTLRIEVGVSELPLHVYANQFQKFASLSFLHLQLHTAQPAFHPPQIPPTSSYQSSLNAPFYPYHHQQQQQQPHALPQLHQQGHGQQPSYHPFPPQPVASGSGGTTGGVALGTPKRRGGGPKRDGEQDENDESTTIVAGSSSSSCVEGTTGPSVPPSHSTTAPPPCHHHHQPHHHPHNVPPQQQQQLAPFPQQQPSLVPPPAPPQPLNTLESAKHIANMLQSLDFVGWNGELYVIVRGGSSTSGGGKNDVERGGRKVDAGVGVDAGTVSGSGDDVSRVSPAIASMTTGRNNATDNINPSTTPAPPGTPSLAHPAAISRTPQQPTPPPTAASTTSSTSSPSSSPSSSSSSSSQAPLPSQTPSQSNVGQGQSQQQTTKLELKELPSRRRLDCGKGVDLGGDDAVWLERKDVPIDYDMPVGGAGAVEG
ncbi:hypothetical protein AN958_02603 [Leucoagaricus sp. SymC.cos]|nr:hypothetical protein AN958_02603 [Leucoagaricus sp. SymC.cos]